MGTILTKSEIMVLILLFLNEELLLGLNKRAQHPAVPRSRPAPSDICKALFRSDHIIVQKNLITVPINSLYFKSKLLLLIMKTLS